MPLLCVLGCVKFIPSCLPHLKEAWIVEQVCWNGLWRLLENQAKLVFGTRFIMVHRRCVRYDWLKASLLL